MSKILPEPVVGQFSPEVLDVYRTLKSIPDDDITVWVSLPLPEASSRPHFLAVVGQRAAYLLAVCTAGQTAAEEAAGLSLFSGARIPERFPGHVESALLQRFVEISLGATLSDEIAETIRGVVVYPHVHQATLDAFPVESRQPNVQFIGSEWLNPAKLGQFFRDQVRPEVTSEALTALRCAFTPESVVPSHFLPSRRFDRNLDAELAPMLLDFDQEQWATQRLVLSPEASIVAEDTPAYGSAALVTGVAGSGKSLVLLFRACTQAKLAPQSRALVLTHNKALKTELEARFGDLGRPPNVQWHTFFSWAHALMSRGGHFPEILQYAERDRLIARVAKDVWGTLTMAQIEFLRDEFDWMQDRDLVDEASYLAAERVGRVVQLREQVRLKVFETFRRYRAELDAAGQDDWSGVALRFLRLVSDEVVMVPEYDFIYIDEAQFFAPVWFFVIRRALRPGSGRILLAADPTQGFLKRRQSWVACGLDLRGRSTKLRRSYRSTRRILEFAANFYRSRLDDDELSELNLPGEEEVAAAPLGEDPSGLLLTSRQDEVGRVINEIKSFLLGGGSPGNILVLVAGELRVGSVVDALRSAFGEILVRDARQDGLPDMIRVCGINAATGLESAIVFVLGCADLLSPENDFNLRDEARQELVRDNTRRLYMAFTRAGSRLIFTWVGTHLPDWANRRRILHGETNPSS